MEITTPKCQCGAEMKQADFYGGMAGASICTKEKYAMNHNYKVNAWYCPDAEKSNFTQNSPKHHKPLHKVKPS